MAQNKKYAGMGMWGHGDAATRPCPLAVIGIDHVATGSSFRNEEGAACAQHRASERLRPSCSEHRGARFTYCTTYVVCDVGLQRNHLVAAVALFVWEFPEDDEGQAKD